MLEIDSVCFLFNIYMGVFTENTLLILGTELLLIQAIVYLKTNRTLHTYGLPEKLHQIGKNVSVLVLAIFHTDLYWVQKDL